MVGVDDRLGLRRERASGRGRELGGVTRVERVGRQPAERLLGPGGAGQAAVGASRCRPASTAAASLNVLHSSSRARSRSRSSKRSSSSSSSASSEPGQEAAGLQLDERRRDEQELGGDVEVEPARSLDLDQVLVDDRGERDLPQVHLLLEDEMEQEVERALVHRGAHLVRHRGAGYRSAVSAIPRIHAPTRRTGGRPGSVPAAWRGCSRGSSPPATCIWATTWVRCGAGSTTRTSTTRSTASSTSTR